MKMHRPLALAASLFCSACPDISSVDGGASTGDDAGTDGDGGKDAGTEEPTDDGGSDIEDAGGELDWTSIATRENPNGVAADESYVYVLIGEPHTDPSSQPIAAGSTSYLQVFRADDGTLADEIQVKGGGHSLRMTPDGKKLYAAHFSLDNVVTVIDTETLSVKKEIGGSLQTGILVPDALSISADGAYVYVGNNNIGSGSVTRIDTSTDTVESGWSAEVTGGYTCWVEVSADGSSLYANSWTGGTIQRKDIATGENLESTQVGSYPHSIVVEPSGTYVYALVSGGNSVQKLDADTLDFVKEIPGYKYGFWGGPVTAILSAEKHYAFVANHAFGEVAVLDIDESSATYDTVVESFAVGDDPIFQALSPDGNTLYVSGNESSTLNRVDVSAWR